MDKKFVSIYNALSICVRKDKPVLRVKLGFSKPQYYPLDTVVLCDRLEAHSEFQGGARLLGKRGDWTVLDADVVSIQYDRGRTYRGTIPGGTTVCRVGFGAPEYAGSIAVRLHGFKDRVVAKLGQKGLVMI